MANRRFQRRKQSGGLTFKAGLMICIWLSVVVLGVPLAAGGVKIAKVKFRELALSVGYVDPDFCVITDSYGLDCTGTAVGAPLRDALHRVQAELADEQRMRREAESALAQAQADMIRMKTIFASQNSIEPTTSAGQVVPPYDAAIVPSAQPELKKDIELAPAPVEVKRNVKSEERGETTNPIVTDNTRGSAATSPADQDEEGFVPAEQDEVQ